jgi:hypothetical protein
MQSILWLSTANGLVTTIHHLHGARIYDTPGRYHAVWLAVLGIAVECIALWAAVAGGHRIAAIGRRTLMAVAVTLFALMFGAFEGGYTHVVRPLIDRGYGSAEPFDPLFQFTGVLHIVPAALTIALAVRYRAELAARNILEPSTSDRHKGSRSR